ncbi:MAG TPA: class I SAM-dependent methyltransferase [Edaphobacter sp.]|jgi:SAM-dependent methyltransferase|nr:class I SAM-dependent methyltransferase [Edaphobacter sp.]
MMRLLAAEGMLTVSTRHPQPKRESTLQSRYHPLNPMPTLQQQFGNIDIYLFDQILRGNIHPGMRVLDAGCGYGRNLVYLLREGYEVFASDQTPEAIAQTRALAAALAPHLPAKNFRLEAIEAISHPDATFDLVLSSAVLHFARDDAHFDAMLNNLWRILKPGGILFCRLASTIGMAHQHLTGRRYLAPDGVERFCVDEALLMHLTAKLNAQLVDPIKTTVVQNQRCMTTWVLRKPTP